MKQEPASHNDFSKEQLDYVNNIPEEQLRGHLLHQVRLRDLMEKDRDAFAKENNKLIEKNRGLTKVKMVVGFMFNENETDVLLIKKNKPRWQFGKLNGIGGKVERHETYGMAMCREFKEETGIGWGDWKYVITMGGDDWEVQVFTAKSDEVFDYKQMEDEKVLLIPISELNSYDHVSNLRWLIPMCLDRNDGKGGIDYDIFIEHQQPKASLEGVEEKNVNHQ